MVKLLSVATISGTVSAFLRPFAEHFRERGWRVDALARGISDCRRCQNSFDRVWDVNWSRNPLAPKNFLSAAKTVRRLVTRERYDIVHVHTPVAAFVTRHALKSLPDRIRPKVVYTAHGFHFHENGSALKNALYLTLEKIAAPWTDELVVINREDELAAKRSRLLPPSQIHYMPGIGVDLSHYGPEGTPPSEVAGVREALHLPADAELILCVAEFIPR